MENSYYFGKTVVVTGGLGFIGSNLVIRLVDLGATVRIIDSCVLGCGSNRYNIAPVTDRMHVVCSDIGATGELRDTIAQADVIFNLAGEVSHIHSMHFPERDFEINARAQLRFLQCCANCLPGVRVVYAGTRQVYGVPEYLPVDELHPIAPVDFNGIHKYAAAMYHLILSRSGQLDAVVLRLTNVYGPRIALNVPCQGFLGIFLRRLLLGEPLEIYGEGEQLRDPVYIDDVVDVLLLAGQVVPLCSRTYNIGGPQALSIREIAHTATEAAGGPALLARPFPESLRSFDIGSYFSNSRLAERDLTWKPKVAFAEGIIRTLEYYRENLAHYLTTADPSPPCKLHTLHDARRQMELAQ